MKFFKIFNSIKEMLFQINKKQYFKQKISFRGELPRRKRGWRLTFALSSLPVLRVFNQDELIRIYLDEEQKSNSVKVERITE